MAKEMYIPIAFKSDPRGLKQAENSLKNFGKVAGAVGLAITAAFSIDAIASWVEQSVKLADQSRRVSRGLEQAVKNSKAFGSSATNIQQVTSALDEASTKLGELTGIDDEVISGLKRNWLAVPRIAATGIKGINKLALVAADVAAGTGKDLETVATAFTKAYGDPKGALGKLTRAGIVLGDQDKKRYDSLIKQGKQTEALIFLTETLGNKYKGQAVANASPFARLEQSLQNFREKIGLAFLPLADQILPGLQQALTDLASNPKFQQSLKDISSSLSDLIPVVIDFTQQSLPVLIDSLRTIADALKPFTDWFNATGGAPQTKQLKQTGSAGLAAVDDAVIKLANRLEARKTLTQTSPGQIVINVNSVSSSAETGKAITNALSSYYRAGGRPANPGLR
jgi:hypothetical protein